MTLTVNTSKLIGLLTDALQTADVKLGTGVHMATHRDGYGDEPGQTDLLAATSTNRFTVGHGRVPVDGQVATSVWPVDSTQTVVHVCKALVEKYGKDHTVDIDVAEMAPPPDTNEDGQDTHPGFMVTLRETTMLFDSETKFAFQAKSDRSFPTRTVYRTLTGQLTDDKYVPSGEIGWSPRVLAAVTAVAKRSKSTMWWYRLPSSPVWLVQVGDSWLGAAVPAKRAPGEAARSAPDTDPLFAEPDDLDGPDDVDDVDGEVVDDPPRAAIEAPRLALPAPPDIVDAEVIDDDEPFGGELGEDPDPASDPEAAADEPGDQPGDAAPDGYVDMVDSVRFSDGTGE